MKRPHAPSSVSDFPANLAFHAARADTAPSAADGDHAEEVLDEPRANFVPSPRDCRA
jgi:hypothetical protein